ncbi:MAG: UbiA family prenyltransferase [Candidatus Odinarchaeota archaeon]
MITKEEKSSKMLGNRSLETEITRKLKITGLIKATRPQFLVAYLIYSIVTLSFGMFLSGSSIDGTIAILTILTVLVSATGVHYRDEAADWNNGYDKEYGGMGVVREGIYESKLMTRLGMVINIAGFLIGTVTILAASTLNPASFSLLFLVGLSMIVVIVFSNYLTEEIPLGHELVTGYTYLATILWVYFGQGWGISLPFLFFALFGYLVVLALIPYQDIGDVEVDRKTGKKTLTVKIGVEPVAHLCIFLALFSLLALSAVFLTI